MQRTTYNLTLLFQCLFIVTLGWWRVAVEQCHHKHAITWIFFLCFSRNRFINNWKSQSFNSCNCIFISFVVHGIIMLYTSCFGLCNLLFALLAEGIHNTNRILICKPCKLYQSLFAWSSATFVCSFTTSGCIAWLKSYTKRQVHFHHDFSAFFQTRFPLTQNARLLPC